MQTMIVQLDFHFFRATRFVTRAPADWRSRARGLAPQSDAVIDGNRARGATGRCVLY
jgi:hypothetical protein